MIEANELRKRMVSGLGFIVPLPDFFIAHETNAAVWVQCPEKRSWADVLAYAAQERGDKWQMAIWVDKVNGKQVYIQNPFPNEFGWMFKIEKVSE